MKKRSQKSEVRSQYCFNSDSPVTGGLNKKIVAALLIFLLTGCGYHVAGKGGGDIPGGIKTVSVPFFANKTSKPEIESVISTHFVDELVKTGLVEVVKGGEGTLKGTIREYKVEPIAFDQDDLVTKYRLTVVLDLLLVRTSGGEVLWEERDFTDYEDFEAPANATSDTEEDAALEKVAADLAKLFKERVIEDF